VTGSAGFGASGVLSGNVELAGDSAIEFKSGQITSLAGSAQLLLYGSDAFIEDSTKLGSDSALTGLANVSGSLVLENDASMSTDGALVNNGYLSLDLAYFDHGGSSLTVAGALTNRGNLAIGNGTFSESDNVTAASLDNTGSIYLNAPNTGQAFLDVTRGVAGFGAAGVLTGNVQLISDSAIEFASGQISTITASSHLDLYGNSAFVEDSTALG
jgi:hypothetical protein